MGDVRPDDEKATRSSPIDLTVQEHLTQELQRWTGRNLILNIDC
jgi:hypothetical protein